MCAVLEQLPRLEKACLVFHCSAKDISKRVHHVLRVLFFGCVYTLFKVSAVKNRGAMSLPKSRQTCLS